MCAYAREVHTGELPGPYTDHNARQFARAALIPEELAAPDRIAHTHRNLQRTARTLKLPAAELAAELADISRAPAPQPQEPSPTRPMKILNSITDRICVKARVLIAQLPGQKEHLR